MLKFSSQLVCENHAKHPVGALRPASPRSHRLPLPASAGAAAEWRGRFGELRAADGSLSTAPAEAAANGEGAGPGFCGFLRARPAYVGVPSMDAVCQHLARVPGLEVSWDTRVWPRLHLLFNTSPVVQCSSMV